MLKVKVILENDYSELGITIELNEDEIRQVACNKARQKYGDHPFNRIYAEDVEFNIEQNENNTKQLPE